MTSNTRSIRLPSELNEKAKAYAQSIDRPVNWIVVQALEEYLTRKVQP